MNNYRSMESFINKQLGWNYRANGCDLIKATLEIDKMIQRNVSREGIGFGKLLLDMNKKVTKALDQLHMGLGITK